VMLIEERAATAGPAVDCASVAGRDSLLVGGCELVSVRSSHGSMARCKQFVKKLANVIRMLLTGRRVTELCGVCHRPPSMLQRTW
jgi:hypothetical protein